VHPGGEGHVAAQSEPVGQDRKDKVLHVRMEELVVGVDAKPTALGSPRRRPSSAGPMNSSEWLGPRGRGSPRT
jgi:hypothetical protein